MSDGALATSGDYERYIEVDGQRSCHLLDPRTGWPAQGLSSVTVISDRCLVAGSLSTIAMLKGKNGIVTGFAGSACGILPSPMPASATVPRIRLRAAIEQCARRAVGRDRGRIDLIQGLETRRNRAQSLRVGLRGTVSTQGHHQLRHGRHEILLRDAAGPSRIERGKDRVSPLP
jgi:ApbE family